MMIPSKSKSSKSAKRATDNEIQAAVRLALRRQIETKTWLLYAANQGMQTGSTVVYPYQACITPQITQGAANGLRIGNSVNVKSATVECIVSLLPYSAGTNPQRNPFWVKLWILSYKSLNNNNIAGTNILSGLFQVNGTSLGPQSTLLDMVLPIDEDSWIIHDSAYFKLGSTAPSATGPVVGTSYFDDSPSSHRVIMRIPQVGKLLFNDAAVTPTNKNYWLIGQVVSSDGSNGAVYFPAQITYSALFAYNDA